MACPDRSKYPTQEAYDKAYDRWSENQQYAPVKTTQPPEAQEQSGGAQ